MSLYSLELRRRHVREVIARDPWRVEIVRSEKDSADDPGLVKWSFTATVKAAGPYRGLEQGSRVMNAANPTSLLNHCILAEWNVQSPKGKDRITATHIASGVVKKFAVITGSEYPFKVEVVVSETQ